MLGLKRNLPIIACLFTFLFGTQAQTDECSCAPTSYRFTIDFDSSCTQYNSTESIASTVCEMDFLGVADTLDLTPVSVDFVIVIELDENNTVIAQQNISYALADGDSFEYVSSIQVDPSTFPSAIQLNVYGSNAAGDTIVSFVAVSFTKNCAAYPVFMDTFSLGWIQFGELVPPPKGVCTFFDASVTPSPTPANITLLPTMAPVIAVSSSPTTAPAEPTSGPVPTTTAPFPMPITMVPTPLMSLSMSLSMSMGLPDYLMSKMAVELEEFGVHPHGKEAKMRKAAWKHSKGSKKGTKTATDHAVPKSDKKGGLSPPTSKEAKKGTKTETNDATASKPEKASKKDGKRQRRLRLHHVET